MKSSVRSLTYPIDLAFQTRVHKHLREVHNIILDIDPEIFKDDTALEHFEFPTFMQDS